MRKYKIEVVGVAPLRMNRLTSEVKNTLQGGRKKLSETEKREEALERTYRDEKGAFIIEAKAIKASILNGGKRIKVGRKSAYGDLRAILFFQEKQMPLAHSDPIIVEEVCRIPPKTGALVLKMFYLFEEWGFEAVLLVTDDRFPDTALKQAIIEAGMYAGLYDGRPDFGRFVLKEFKELSK